MVIIKCLWIIINVVAFICIASNISEIIICDERGLFGCGNTHNINLHPSIILNRIAGQIALGSAPFIQFPNSLRKFDCNFMDWINSKFKRTKKLKYKLKSTDWPPRYLFGEAHIDKFYDLISIYKKKTNIKIKLINTKILEIKKIKKLYHLKTSENFSIKTDKILICTGVTKRFEVKNGPDIKLKKLLKNTKSKYISDFLTVIPDKNFFKDYKKKLNVCLFGAGVSSLDIINFFTVDKDDVSS